MAFSPGMKIGYVRKLSSTERVYLVLGELYPPFANQWFWEGTGVLDANLWRAAVEKAAAANIGSRLILKGSLNSARWIDSGKPPPVREIDGGKWSGFDSNNAELLDSPLSPFRGPSCEILLIRGTPLRFFLRTHHSVMDGLGTLTFVEDIFRALRGEPVIGSEARSTEREIARSFQKNHRAASPARYIAPTGKAEGCSRRVCWHRVQITGRYQKLLPQIAVIVARQARLHSNGPVRIAIPVDLRFRKNGLRSTSNLTNFIYVDVNPHETYSDINNKIKQQIDECRDGELYPGDELVRYMPLSLIRRLIIKRVQSNHARGLYNSSALISNLGRKYKAEDFSGGGFQTTIGSAVPPGSELYPCSIGSGAYGNTIELVVSIPEVLATRGRLEKLIDAIVNGLEKQSN